MGLENTIREFWKYVRASGRRGAAAQFKYFLHRIEQKRNYRKWIELNRITDDRRAQMRREIAGFSRRPLISIVLPVYDIREKWLRLCIESVTAQLYENWQLCIADDASPSPHVKRVLMEYAAADARVKTVFREQNGHISAASNSALEIADGEFTVLLDHDDELSEDALFYVARELDEYPETAMIYSDEDLIGENGHRFDPKFKPDWSPDFFYSTNIVTHLSGYRTEILKKLGGFTLGLEGSQDYDLALRVTERIREDQIRHIPRILYHWRVIEGSVALSGDEKPYAHRRGREAIRRHLARTGKKASVEPAVYDLHRVRYELPADPPKVSLIFQADEDAEFTREALNDIFEKTVYQDLEAVLICREKTAGRLAEQFPEKSSVPLKFVGSPGENTAADLNRAVSESAGEIVCFVDLNLSPLSVDWLTELVRFALQKEIGAAGAKILSADDTVVHGGLIIGAGEMVAPANSGLPREKDGHLARAQLVNNFSAVSAACLATRRGLFQQTGGFDAENLTRKFFDADYCLKLREQKLRIVFTPYAELIVRDENRRTHLQGKAPAGEVKYFAQKWKDYIENDPAYNPNFSKKDGRFSIGI